jgi:anthranilate phosphoribosyltransferase
MAFLPYLHRVTARENLTTEDACHAMTLILSGSASTVQIAAFLVALKMKGETPDEIVGLAQAMRAKAPEIHAGDGPGPLLDTCGTGGDNAGTFNISTIVAFVVAGAGVRVAKHGNRSLSSLCGSADIMESLGVNIALSPDQMGKCIQEVGIGFLFAPGIHSAMKYAQPARVELKMRTAFNLLGPLTNPAGATIQLAGAPSRPAADLIAEALAKLGLRRGFVVHGSDGLDEITTTGTTYALEIVHGAIAHHTLSPEDFGIDRAKPDDLLGGDPATNRQIAQDILAGAPGPRRNIVLVNAAAALVAAGKAASFIDGMKLAAESIDSGAAAEKLRRLAEFANALAIA